MATALALGRTLSRLLYGVSATGAATLVAVLVVLGARRGCFDLAATRRAVRVNPLSAIRHET